MGMRSAFWVPIVLTERPRFLQFSLLFKVTTTHLELVSGFSLIRSPNLIVLVMGRFFGLKNTQYNFLM